MSEGWEGRVRLEARCNFEEAGAIVGKVMKERGVKVRPGVHEGQQAPPQSGQWLSSY
jgi:hypothetical protein